MERQPEALQRQQEYEDTPPMNILHLSAVKNWGGGENHIQNLCTELGRLSPEVNNLVFCVENGIFYKRLEKSCSRVIPAALDFKMDPRYVWKLISVCKKEKIDLIHIHDTTALTLAVMADHFYNLPPFILSKKTSFPIKPRRQTLFKYNYPKIKRILCVSKATEAITRKSISNREKIKCIYHGTAPVTLAASKIDLRKKLQIKDDVILIGNIGNHIRAKNLQTFLQVANELINVRKIINLHFVQIGAFSDKTAELKKLTRELNLLKHVSFLGDVERASGMIPQFSLSLVTSQSEGLPQFIYESLYLQVPVVSTDVGGIPEVIIHKQNGLLSPAHDVTGLADNIQLLIEQPELQKELTKGTKKLIEENFTSAKMAKETLKEYKNVINGRY